jgi:rhodanese-related sulfurtransferase
MTLANTDVETRYTGDVTSCQAFDAVSGDPTAVLVDCRTEAEWLFVGVPAVAGTVFVEWTRFPDGAVNPRFFDELAEAGVTPDKSVYFICRSGQRSRSAAIAATSAGYASAYNVADGFEGHINGDGRRGVVGWKAAGLPWRQT